ncbi:MAG TPA: hypothetical protein VFL14_01365 [Xanthomonadales bacterium]|nr:hypothetical protein [Xanthomonadales bacterium]
MRNFDFGSWEGVLSTVVGLALITLIGVGIRLLVMQTVQQRRERENRQINERLRTLIAAYRTLGGSFTGDIEVDPTHKRDLRGREPGEEPGSDRARRIRDAVQAALSDILLLGTDEQVRLAARAAADLAAGRKVRTSALVVSLRDFVREVLDLDPVPKDLAIPQQGPTRPAAGGGKARGEGARDAGERGERGGGGRGGGGAGGAAGAGGAGLAAGLHLGADRDGEEPALDQDAPPP